MTITDPFTVALEFDDPAPRDSESIVRDGRYRLPNRDGSPRPNGWTRCTNIVGVLADQYALRDWELRNLLVGLCRDAGLYWDACALVREAENTTKGLKPYQGRVNDLLARAKEVAGGNAGAAWGSREHVFIERWHLDMVEPDDLDARHRLHLYRQAVEAVFEPIPEYVERLVMIEWADMCGRLDNLMRCRTSGMLHVVDTKTQRQFYTWLTVEAQLAGYANADAMWDTARGMWVDMPADLDRTRGAIAWVPRPEGDEQPRAEVRQLDLERGWRNFKLAVDLYRQRAACKSARQAVSGLPWTPVARTTEAWARVLNSVESMADGSRVVAEIRAAGAWCPALEQVARDVAERISGRGLTPTKN